VFKTFYGFRSGMDKLSVSTLCNMQLRFNRRTFAIVSILTATVRLRSTLSFSYWRFVRDYFPTSYTGLQGNKIDYPEELVFAYVSPYIKGTNVRMG